MVADMVAGRCELGFLARVLLRLPVAVVATDSTSERAAVSVSEAGGLGASLVMSPDTSLAARELLDTTRLPFFARLYVPAVSMLVHAFARKWH